MVVRDNGTTNGGVAPANNKGRNGTMYQLTVTTRKQLERATLRAQSEKLHFEEVVFGVYKVRGSTGNFYSTGIEAATDGEGYDVCCSCPTQKTFCKHVSTVFPHFLMREKEIKAEEVRMVQAQELTDSEWEEIELRAETAQMIEEVERMLEKDRLDVFGY
jgi:hypothetical protein